MRTNPNREVEATLSADGSAPPPGNGARSPEHSSGRSMTTMRRRAAVRKSDLTAALTTLISLGLTPRVVTCQRDGSFSLAFEESSAAADELDAELAAFEARHGRS